MEWVLVNHIRDKNFGRSRTTQRQILVIEQSETINAISAHLQPSFLVRLIIPADHLNHRCFKVFVIKLRVQKC